MILEVLPNIRVFHLHNNSGSRKNGTPANARQFKDLRGLKRTRRNDELAGGKCRKLDPAMGEPDSLGFPIGFINVLG